MKQVLGDVLRTSGGLEAEGLVDDFVLSTRPSLSHASDVSLVLCYFFISKEPVSQSVWELPHKSPPDWK